MCFLNRSIRYCKFNNDGIFLIGAGFILKIEFAIGRMIKKSFNVALATILHLLLHVVRYICDKKLLFIGPISKLSTCLV